MLSKVSMSLFCNSTAEPPPLLTWQAKILPVLSVARVTTRSLPSRMMDPTLLHFRRRYRKKKKKKEETWVRKVKWSSQANWETFSEGNSGGEEGENEPTGPGRTNSKDNLGTKQYIAYTAAYLLSLYLKCKKHTIDSPSGKKKLNSLGKS